MASPSHVYKFRPQPNLLSTFTNMSTPSAPQAYPTMMPQQHYGQPGAYPPYQPQIAQIATDDEPSLCTQIVIRIVVTIIVCVVFALIKIFLL